jgi:asparagine synthase (glutamine-hydrolysing)
MGALVAVISKRGGNVAQEAIKMLKALRHRGSDLHGISTGKETIIARDISELSSLLNAESNVILGYNFSQNLLDDVPQPIEAEDFTMIFDGKIFSPIIDKREIKDLIGRDGNVEDSIKNFIRKVNGSFSFVILKDNKLLAGRDPVGAKPLYFCEGENFYALASERKALWLLGVGNERVKSFPPGSFAEISGGGMRVQPVKVLEMGETRKIDEEKAVEEVYNLLFRSVREKSIGLDRVSIAFSGGLDSSIIASIAGKCVKNVLLISVGLDGSKDLDNAERISGEIGLPFRAEAYTINDVEEVLPKVLWLIEEANALKAAICIPEFWLAEKSFRMGYKAMFSGQGSDELFAGYHKYLKSYAESLKAAEENLYYDALRLHEASLEPEEKICTFHNVEVRFPYVDYDLASFALSLPVTLKISSSNDPLRKRILRKLAEHIGLPLEVYLKPKKAIQYGTGVSQALRKIAKKNRLNVQDLINQVFNSIEWFK